MSFGTGSPGETPSVQLAGFDISRADLLRWSKLFDPPTAEESAFYGFPTH
jgi:hypothetical protein